MSASTIIEKYQNEQGWTDATLLQLLIIYLENQCSDEALEDYLSEAAGEGEC